MSEIEKNIRILFSHFEVEFVEGQAIIELKDTFAAIGIMRMVNSELQNAAELNRSGLVLKIESGEYSTKDLREVLDKTKDDIKNMLLSSIAGRDIKEPKEESESERQQKKCRIENVLEGVFVRSHKDGFIARNVSNAAKVVNYINDLTWDSHNIIAAHTVKFYPGSDQIYELSHGDSMLGKYNKGKRDIFFSGGVFREYDVLGAMEEHAEEIRDIMGKGRKLGL